MKRILFSTLLLFFVMVASAQFNLGLKAGYNSSLSLNNLNSLSTGDYNLGNVKAEMWNNFQAGAFARVFINKFYIQPEVLYSIQKKEFDIKNVIIGDADPKDVNTYMDISSVQVPVYLGLKLLDMKVANLRVFAGPKFIMNSGSKLEYKNLTSEEVSASDLAQDFKDSQIDLEAGVGVDVLMFALDAKLNVMQDVAGKISSVNDLSNVPMPTSTFVISLSWKLF
jgi:hypothetical protein